MAELRQAGAEALGTPTWTARLPVNALRMVLNLGRADSVNPLAQGEQEGPVMGRSSCKHFLQHCQRLGKGLSGQSTQPPYETLAVHGPDLIQDHEP